MLSRVAENIYWMGRYLERAENCARLLISTTHMLLDAPPRRDHAEVLDNWRTLVTTLGADADFAATGRPFDAQTIMAFMTTDRDNASSILSALHFARENLRTTRDVFPKKAMEYLNAMYLDFQQRMGERGNDEGKLYKALDQVIQESQKITGLLFSTMSRDNAFEFFRQGQNLERADMTTRILDVGAADYADLMQDQALAPFVNSIWLNTLRALSAEQMYRHHCRPRISGGLVVRYLLTDDEFPRSFARCLIVVDNSLSHIDRSAPARKILHELEKALMNADIPSQLEAGQLPAFLDRLQIGLGALHRGIHDTYFIAAP